MKAVIVVVAVLMLTVMDPIVKSNSPSLVQAACVEADCAIYCSNKDCDNGYCDIHGTGNCRCSSCHIG
uniref:AKTx n=1 Tax=Romanomermis culicivorax TaxID=13658 RepID=A0A915K071_ROMCU